MSGRLVAIFLAFAVATFTTGTCIFLDIIVGNQGQQITQLRTQLGQAQRAEQQDRAGFAAERAAFAQAEARIGGTHRNLLTCGDLIEIEQNVTYSWQASGSSGPVTLNTQWLPGHCYNQ